MIVRVRVEVGRRHQALDTDHALRLGVMKVDTGLLIDRAADRGAEAGVVHRPGGGDNSNAGPAAGLVVDTTVTVDRHIGIARPVLVVGCIMRKRKW